MPFKFSNEFTSKFRVIGIVDDSMVVEGFIEITFNLSQG